MSEHRTLIEKALARARRRGVPLFEGQTEVVRNEDGIGAEFVLHDLAAAGYKITKIKREEREERVRLVALVTKLTEPELMKVLADMRPKLDPGGDGAWWIAENDRIDGSDCDSAVFVPYEPKP